DPPAFTVDLGPDLSVLLGETVDIAISSSEEASRFQWRPGSIDCEPPCDVFSTVILEDTDISLLATTAQGCQARDEVQVTVDGLPEVFIPNVFSPNGDEINDFFTVYTAGFSEAVSQVVKLSVVDRSGREVFSKESFPAGVSSSGWDGSENGKDATSGVYFYAATVAFINGQQVDYKGRLLLVR
ncbi:MAG: gliding motility-associated C-terminal domain-containing protein, partial [Bacteroidota bacterium]